MLMLLLLILLPLLLRLELLLLLLSLRRPILPLLRLLRRPSMFPPSKGLCHHYRVLLSGPASPSATPIGSTRAIPASATATECCWYSYYYHTYRFACSSQTFRMKAKRRLLSLILAARVSSLSSPEREAYNSMLFNHQHSKHSPRP